MAPISPPASVNDAVVLFPDDFNPYGAKCEMDRTLQAICFHYGLRLEDVKVLVDQGFVKAKEFEWANPCGDSDEIDCFDECVNKQIPKKLYVRKAKAVWKRVLSKDPLAPIVLPPPPPPPSKRSKKGSSSSATDAAVTPGVSTPVSSDSSLDNSTPSTRHGK